MARADKIEAEFPPGIIMPPKLRKLCDYLDQTDYPISGCMKLRPEGEILKSVFGDSDAWCQLAGFGAGPDGSMLAIWMNAGQDPAHAPIVHFGSEGGEIKVLADNIVDFLTLFGIGYDELGYDDLSQPPKDPESAAKLRAWLHAEFGIRSPTTGIEIMQRAQARHPDFAQWVAAAEEQTVVRGPEVEALRQRVVAIAAEMIRDGRSKVYTLSSPWWSMVYKIERNGNKLSLTYLDYGEWYPVPPNYQLASVVADLLKFVRHPDRQHFELSACGPGFVDVGPYKELVLIPPEEEAT